MSGRIILPPQYHPDLSGHLIFLGGPIQGADDWQKDAIFYIRQRNKEVHIANPRRPGNEYAAGDFSKSLYDEQVDWESYHLKRAGADGVVMFWLAKESVHICERAYAQTTRFELSEWKMNHQFTGSKLVVGIADGFTGAKYIRRRFSQDCPDVKVCSNLEETCKEAVILAYK